MWVAVALAAAAVAAKMPFADDVRAACRVDVSERGMFIRNSLLASSKQKEKAASKVVAGFDFGHLRRAQVQIFVSNDHSAFFGI